MDKQEKQVFEQMLEALKGIVSAHPVTTSLRQTDAVIAAIEAIAAANAVSAKLRSRKQNFNLTPTQLQMIGAGEMDDPRDQRPQAT